jgi:hypothetical protein
MNAVDTVDTSMDTRMNADANPVAGPGMAWRPPVTPGRREHDPQRRPPHHCQGPGETHGNHADDPAQL